MKRRLLNLIPYLVVLAADFYLLPLAIKNTGLAMLMLLFVIPFVSFICAVIYGVRRGFDFLLPIAATALFAPTIFIFYNSSAWVYIVAYAVISLAGSGVGCIFHEKR